MQKILIIGYKKELVDKIISSGDEVVCLIDKFDDPEFLPPIQKKEERITIKDTANDFFTLSTLLVKGHITFDAVISPFEYTQFNAAVLAEYYNCPTPGMEIISAFRNKVLQKSKLSNKIQYAKFWEIDDIDIRDSLNHLPLVIKPNSGTGTFQTYKVRNEEEYFDIFNTIDEKTERFPSILVEEFIEGEEYYVDGWIEDNKVNYFTISKYITPLINIHNGNLLQGITLNTKKNFQFYREIEDFLNIIFQDLKLNNSIFHLEFFLNNKNIVFGECGSRIGGNMTEAAFLHQFNIDLDEVLLNLSLGENTNVSHKERKVSKNTGFTILPTPYNFTTKSILPKINKLKLKFPEIIDVRYDWETGMEVPDHTSSTSERIGMVLVSGRDESEILNSLSNIATYFENFYKKEEVNISE